MEFLRKHKRLFLGLGICICIAAIVLTVSPGVGPTVFERGLSHIVVPMQRGITSFTGWVRGRFALLADNRRLLEENQALRNENSLLRMENQRLLQADDDNIYLSALLNISRRYAELPVLGARVIGQTTNDWYDSFIIDRGSDDGITTNMAVLGDGGLLGVVRRVFPTHSVVVSVLDIRFNAAVMSRRTEDRGIARGEITLMQQGLMRMNHIDGAAQIMPGDEIITSPHSTMFPPDILLGTVLSVTPNPDGLTQHAIIRPAVNLDSREMVLVVTERFGDVHNTRDGFLDFDGE
jgi:rod shape-determining protein MreC